MTYDQGPYKKRLGPRYVCAQRKDNLKTQREGSQLSAGQGKRLQKKPNWPTS